MSRQRLIKRLEWYYPTERLHTFVTFPAIVCYVVIQYNLLESLFLIFGLLVCIYILYQGQHYWKLKLSVLKGEPVEQNGNLAFFRRSKKANAVLISLMPFLFVFQLYLVDWTWNGLLTWGLVTNIFTILEHINYYYIQLSVDNKFDIEYVRRNKRLKKASLAKDLDEKRI